MSRLRAASSGVSLPDICADFEPRRVRQALVLAGLSNHQAAERIGLGVTPAAVNHWQHGSWKPRPLELQRLAEVTDQLPEFFRRGRPMASLDSGHIHWCEKRRRP